MINSKRENINKDIIMRCWTPNLANKIYLYIMTNVKNKINVSKIITNSHELHNDIGCWSIVKTPWDERFYHPCDTNRLEYENHFLLDCSSYTHIWYNFQNTCHTTNIFYVFSEQNLGNTGMIILMFFDHRNKMLKSSR